MPGENQSLAQLRETKSNSAQLELPRANSTSITPGKNRPRAQMRGKKPGPKIARFALTRIFSNTDSSDHNSNISNSRTNGDPVHRSSIPLTCRRCLNESLANHAPTLLLPSRLGAGLPGLALHPRKHGSGHDRRICSPLANPMRPLLHRRVNLNLLPQSHSRTCCGLVSTLLITSICLALTPPRTHSPSHSLPLALTASFATRHCPIYCLWRTHVIIR